MATFKDQVIGTWELVSYTIKDENGNEYYPLGEDAKGFIMYNPDGYMSAQLTATGRPPYESGDLHNGTQEEMSEAAHGYLAYSGRFEVEEATQTLKHHMEVSMNPTWLDNIQERYVVMEGNQIVIKADSTPATLTWRKVTPNKIA